MNTPSTRIVYKQVKALMENKTKVKWRGHYMEDGLKKKLKMKSLRVNPDGVIYGKGKDRLGRFYLKGLLGSKYEFEFTMHYKRSKYIPATAYGVFRDGVLKGTITYEDGTKDFEIEMEKNLIYRGVYERTDVDAAEIRTSIKMIVPVSYTHLTLPTILLV